MGLRNGYQVRVLNGFTLAKEHPESEAASRRICALSPSSASITSRCQHAAALPVPRGFLRFVWYA